MTRNAFGGSDKLPLAMVDARGNNVIAAYIRPLVHGGYFVEAAAKMPSLLSGETRDGFYDDLPYFLFDLRPQGFPGRRIAREIAAQSPDFPADPRHWNTNHIGRYLISNGDDLPGNLKFGEQTLLRVRQQPAAVLDSDYPILADDVMKGIIPRSSAGGEQPKFTAFNSNSSSHVIVKFSPKGENEIARRWCDVLITEYHAAKIIQNENLPAAETRLLEMDGRLFLESLRFDRSGEYGRESMLSLQSIDAEFVGLGSNWPQVLNALYQKKLISRKDVFNAELLWHFGQLINNTDMHLGNLSLAIGTNGFTLLPIYDMCSMGFAPKNGGEVPPYSFIPVEHGRINIDDDDYNCVKNMANNYWKRIADDQRISDEFNIFLDQCNPVFWESPQ